MLKEKFLFVVLTILFFVILALPFLFRSSPPSHRSEVVTSHRLVILSPHWEGIRREFSRAFLSWSKNHLGAPVTLDWLDVGGTSEAVRFVRAEFSRHPAGIGVDLFFGGGLETYLQLKKEGLLEKCALPKKLLTPIPATVGGIEIYDPDLTWFGACLSGFGIIYNKKVLSLMNLPEPQEWADLSRREYMGWVGSGDPRASGSVHMAYEIILQAYGWEEGWSIIQRLAGNVRHFSRAGSDVPKDTAVGEIALGMAIDVYAWREMAEAGSERIGFVLPAGRTVINPDGIAILRGAPHKDLSQKFISFVLSEDGQKLWVLKKGKPNGPVNFDLSRMPILPGLVRSLGTSSSVPIDAFQDKPLFTYNAKKGATRWLLLNDLLGSFIIDNHQALVTAWQEIKNLPFSEPRFIRFTAPPLPEEEVMELAKGAMNDPKRRAQLRAQWAAAGREKYTALRKGSWKTLP